MNWSLRFFAGTSFVLGMCLSLNGCSGAPGDQPDLGTVRGTITIDGQPREDILIYFTPADGGRPSTGLSKQDGEYELVYSTSAMGAKCGKHTVTIAKYNEIDQNAAIPVMPDSKGDLPEGYVDIKKTVDVKPGKNVIHLSYPE